MLARDTSLITPRNVLTLAAYITAAGLVLHPLVAPVADAGLVGDIVVVRDPDDCTPCNVRLLGLCTRLKSHIGEGRAEGQETAKGAYRSIVWWILLGFCEGLHGRILTRAAASETATGTVRY